MYPKLSLLPLFLTTTATSFLLPNPPGRYNVTLTTGPLTDNARAARTLMLSVFQPSTCAFTTSIQNMPNKTASYQGPWIQEMFDIPVDLTPLFLSARLPVCSSSCSPVLDAPILLYSPGYRGSRLWYNVMASAIASEGFTVITIDHPGESNIIEYPDGHTIYSNLSNANVDDIAPYAPTRAADISFIIDQLGNMTDLLPANVSIDRVGVLGHSLGGAAAVLAASQDPRINAVINLDGPFFGSLPAAGLSTPVLYIATEREDDPRMLSIWPDLTGPKLWIKVKGMAHEAMLDLPAMLQVAGQYTGDLAAFFGTVGPEEWAGIMVAFTREWMDGAFGGMVGGGLLDGEGLGGFPVVEVVRKGNF